MVVILSLLRGNFNYCSYQPESSGEHIIGLCNYRATSAPALCRSAFPPGKRGEQAENRPARQHGLPHGRPVCHNTADGNYRYISPRFYGDISMATIAPFAGIHFRPDLPLAEVIAPPYDVLSPAQQAALYERHEQNIVRLILNRDAPDVRYHNAAQWLRDRLADGTLVQDATPALYEYVQKFAHPHDPARIVTRTALFVALKLEPYAAGVVLPHEETHPKAKADRLEVMRTTFANPEPIYGLYEDPNLTVAKSLDAVRPAEPLLKAAFARANVPDSEQHLIYRHDGACLLSDLEEWFASRRVWIADGHHRYETALNFQREQREKDGNPSDLQPYDFLLIGLSAFDDPGLVVLPTHRLIKNIEASRLEELPLLLERYFTVQVVSQAAAREWIKTEAAGERRFAALLPDKAYQLTLRDLSLMDSAVSEPHCEAWKRLDVSILQTLVLDRCLNISWQALAHTPDVAYTRDEAEAVEKVASGAFQIAFLLQNPAVTEVRDVASAGDKMPQKSTFFYPKLWSGLVLRSLRPTGGGTA